MVLFIVYLFIFNIVTAANTYKQLYGRFVQNHVVFVASAWQNIHFNI